MTDVACLRFVPFVNIQFKLKQLIIDVDFNMLSFLLKGNSELDKVIQL